MLICEDLFLLLTKDSGAREGGADTLGLKGAVLVDLMLLGRVRLSDDKRPRIHVVDASPVGHPALDQALQEVIRKDGKRLQSVLGSNRIRARENISTTLEAAGVIERTTGGLFGLSTRYPTLDPTPELETRGRLASVLRGDRVASAQDLTLLSILQALGMAHRILPTSQTGLGRGDLKRAITSLHLPGQPGDAVAEAISSVISATTTAIVSAATVASVSSGA